MGADPPILILKRQEREKNSFNDVMVYALSFIIAIKIVKRQP